VRAEIAEFWKQWEGRVVDGQFLLRRLLGGGEAGAVFLTEQGQNRPAAVKLVHSDARTDELRLSRWQQASKLSHPHLVRLFRSGRCQLDQNAFLYALMEYADEDLSQVLPNRALTPTEAREMLAPALGALGYLHKEGFVHGHLKPSNLMAVDNQLKISSDGLGRIGDRREARIKADAYDPPEIETGGVSPAGDVWSLGVVLVEVLTQRFPVWTQAHQREPDLPSGIEEPFLEIVRRCLQADPRNRRTVADLEIQLNPSGRKVVRKTPASFPVLRYGLPAGVLALAAVVMLLGRRTPATPTEASVAPPVRVEAPKAVAAPAPAPTKRAARTSPEIVRQIVPEVSRKARNTIRGRVVVDVKATVDAAGNVKEARAESSSSKYFSGVATKAARQWKFRPEEKSGREWNLQFEFTKSGTKVRATR
jgi:TonB family protein